MLAAQKRYNYEEVPEYHQYEKKEEKVKIITVTREKAVRRLKAILSIAIFFAVGMFILFRYSQINQENKNIYKLKTELNQLYKNNTQLEASLNQKIDLDDIEKLAIEKLGMQYPDKNQVVYVQLPKNDFTEIPGNAENKPGESNKSLAAFAQQMVRYLY